MVSLNPTEDPLAFAVLKSPRLLAMLPQDELNQLLTAHDTAKRTAAAARLVQIPEVDVVGAVDADLRAGKQIDPAALIEQLAAATTARANRDRVVELLEDLPRRYSQDVIRLVDNHVDAMYDRLGEELTDLLDRAEKVVKDLGGVSNADEAIEAGKAEAWAAFRGLVKEYHDLRSGHLALLRGEDQSNFTVSNPVTGYAFFAGLDDALPDYHRATSTGTHDGFFRVAADATFPVLATDDPAHLMAVVRDRARLRPHIGLAGIVVNAVQHNDSRLRAAAMQDLPVGEGASYYGGEAAYLGHALGRPVGGGEIVNWGWNRPS